MIAGVGPLPRATAVSFRAPYATILHFLALAGLVLGAAPAWAAYGAGAAQRHEAPQRKAAPHKAARDEVARDEAAQDEAAQDEAVQEQEATGPSPVARVAEWIAASGDNDSLPYVIIDKNSASLFLFDADGTPLADAPVLIGIAVGDDATPGVGDKDLAEIGPAEKTTPAGRFLARYGMAAGGQMVLWVDYADSVALHPIPPGVSKKEQRRERMLSPTSDDNRITFGCINVPRALYNKSIRPLFQENGGYVYVLPDTRQLEEVFPRLMARPARTRSNFRSSASR